MKIKITNLQIKLSNKKNNSTVPKRKRLPNYIWFFYKVVFVWDFAFFPFPDVGKISNFTT